MLANKLSIVYVANRCARNFNLSKRRCVVLRWFVRREFSTHTKRNYDLHGWHFESTTSSHRRCANFHCETSGNHCALHAKLLAVIINIQRIVCVQYIHNRIISQRSTVHISFNWLLFVPQSKRTVMRRGYDVRCWIIDELCCGIAARLSGHRNYSFRFVVDRQGMWVRIILMQLNVKKGINSSEYIRSLSTNRLVDKISLKTTVTQNYQHVERIQPVWNLQLIFIQSLCGDRNEISAYRMRSSLRCRHQKTDIIHVGHVPACKYAHTRAHVTSMRDCMLRNRKQSLHSTHNTIASHRIASHSTTLKSRAAASTALSLAQTALHCMHPTQRLSVRMHQMFTFTFTYYV